MLCPLIGPKKGVMKTLYDHWSTLQTFVWKNCMKFSDRERREEEGEGGGETRNYRERVLYETFSLLGRIYWGRICV